MSIRRLLLENRRIVLAATVLSVFLAVLVLSSIRLRHAIVKIAKSPPPTPQSPNRLAPIDVGQLKEIPSELHPDMAGGEHYKPLLTMMDLPGIEQPELISVDDADLPEWTDVVGIEINGQAYAFDLRAMEPPSQHIVNLDLDEIPVSVTYCSLVDCARVLTRKEKGTIPLRVGGLDFDYQMVLLLDGERYGQKSPGIPLSDLPFTRTSLGNWKDQYPSSRIFTASCLKDES